MTTATIRTGALVTPLARRRPWVVARQKGCCYPIFAGSGQLSPPHPAENLAQLRAELTELGAHVRSGPPR
jgi:hypothetical protein